MRKAIFYSSLVVAILLLVSIINILLFDLNRLTDYGYGYLVGKTSLFLLVAGVVYLSKKRKVTLPPASTSQT